MSFCVVEYRKMERQRSEEEEEKEEVGEEKDGEVKGANGELEMPGKCFEGPKSQWAESNVSLLWQLKAERESTHKFD